MSNLLDFFTYSDLAEEHGPSFFVLEADKLLFNFRSLHNAFLANYHKVEIGYSYKTNYTPQICRILHDEGAMAEVVSEMEYSAARRLGIPHHRIIFNGPYKAAWAFRDAALGGATINLDSFRDLDLLTDLANTPSIDQNQIRVVIRVNFAIDQYISRFGFDVESSDFDQVLDVIRQLQNVHLAGLHCHFPNRDLDSFRRRVEGLLHLCNRIFPDGPPEVLNIGGGFYSSLPSSLRKTMAASPASFDDYGALVGQLLKDAFPHPDYSPTLYLEPGTALVADVMTFYTKVLSTKNVRGHYFATVTGSIFDISPNAKTKSLPVTPILNPAITRGSAHNFVISGFTCIESDILSDSLSATLETGDVLAYGNVGSYSVVMRPPFILPSCPVLMANIESSGYDVIKSRQSNEDVFDLFDRNYY